jgi:hypothetical protein
MIGNIGPAMYYARRNDQHSGLSISSRAHQAGRLGRGGVWVAEHGKGFEALCAGDGRLGAALWLIGQVEILKLALLQSGFNARSEFSLPCLDGSQDGCAAILQLAFSAMDRI